MSQSSSNREGAGSPGGPGSPRDAGSPGAVGRSPGQPAGMQDGYSIIAYLLSGAILFGGAGWLTDRLLGTSFLVGMGLLVGAGFSLYLVYVRINTGLK